MAWKNLKAEIEEEFQELAGSKEVTPDVVSASFRRFHRRSALEMPESMPETRAQRQDRHRRARARRVEGLTRGQHITDNAAAQRRYLERQHARGLPRGGKRGKEFKGTPEQLQAIRNRNIPTIDLAIMLGVSRSTAFRLRKLADVKPRKGNTSA